MRISTLLLSMFFLVAGCAVGPDFERPEVTTEEAFQSSEGVQSSDERIADFWRYFNDSMLHTLIDDAIRANKEVQSALSRVNEARAVRREAFLNLFPIASVTGDFTRSKFGQNSVPPIPEEFTKHEAYSASVDATWEIDLFGGLRREIEARDADQKAREALLKDALRIVVSEVARNYLELRGSQELLSIAKRNTESQKETVKLVNTLFEVGNATELDKVRTEAQYQTTLATIPALEATVSTYMYRLSVLTGKMPTALEEMLKDPKPLARYEGPITIGNPQDLLRRRPDVRNAEEALRGSTAEIGVQISNLFPKIELVGDLSVQAPSFRELSSKGADGYSYGPRISWSILNLQGVLARIDAADERAKTALYGYEQSVLSALEDAHNALSRFTAERTRQTALALAKESSLRAATLARAQYQDGATDLLTVLDSDRNLLASEDALCRSETALQNSIVAIYKSLGGGWEGVTVN